MPLETMARAKLQTRRPAAPETLRLYAGDWAAFAAWCGSTGNRALPAEPETVAAWLEARARTHGYGALTRNLAAIAAQHRRRGFSPPARTPALMVLLRDLRGRPERRLQPPPSPYRLNRLAAACSGDRIGQRDRALLLLLAMGLGRTTLVGLDAEDVRLTTLGMDLTLCGGDTDGAPARILSIARHPVLPACPVRALEDWMRASETAFGPVFRKVDRWGNVEHRRLGADAVRLILQRWNKRAKPAPIRRAKIAGKRGASAPSPRETP